MATINIRVTKQEKAELRAFAKHLGMTLSAYLRDAATQEAHRVLLRTPPLPTAKATGGE